ncbi:MAG: hypothetical protein HC929_03375 [Leptolyngbyaceae cyanobacterium SM2_5_2]|nr:hypothetical protein [Leptolyngbyaceae cyanobacterium SM2_5_2]
MGDRTWVLALRQSFWSGVLLLSGSSAVALPMDVLPLAPGLMAQAPAAPNQPTPSGLEAWLEENQVLAKGTATVVALAVAYGVVLLVKPRLLLYLPGKFKIPNTSWEVPLGLLLWLKYQPRVLDAWVAGHLTDTQKKFFKSANRQRPKNPHSHSN